ncbi:MAG: tetratricopeptide repeat protein [Bdellovibrio sp.]
MSKFFLFCITIAFTSLYAKAEESNRLSSQSWGQNWAQSWFEKQNTTFETQSVEKKLFGKCFDCTNKDSLNKGRALFAKGQFDEAITNYNSIPRGNTYWLSAVEEKGWAYFRQENYEKALAQTKTLLAPQFAEIVNSEAFLLQSLAQLKICDYKSVFETNTIFKEKQKARILEVQNLAKSGWNSAIEKVLNKVDEFPLTLNDIADAAPHLPLLIYKDIEFQKQIFRFKALEKAVSFLNSNTDLSEDEKGASVFEKQNALVKNLENLKSKSLDSLKKRIRELAQAETDANFKVIQKLNLVEVEAIQRVHTDLELGEEVYKKSEFRKTSSDELIFMDDGKPWIDELDKFEVSAKTCVKGIRRKM